ncbi:MAG: hypothetical protein DYG89_30420 [Caldilinea sp. CFX5]|nr:hypothetical protein [Caldilinea sp. CFX5]
MNRMHKVLITLAALVLLLTACVAVAAPQPAAAIPEITIMTHEYAFDAPKEIPAGLVRVKLMDHGKEPHHVQFARLNDGVTLDQFMAALQKGEAEAFPLITFPGGVAPIDPGSSASAVINLPPGNYVLLCFVPAADGLPHLAKGMVAPVTVVESNTKPVEPVADATVKLIDFSFILPTDIKAGKQIWKVVNEGSQLHEINLMKLADGKTLDDVAAWMAQPEGAPPFHNVGGYNALDAEKVGWMDLDLTPGQYVAICHVPDPASGKPHEALGMVLPFTVK